MWVNKLNFSEFMNTAKREIAQRGPGILLGLGISGMFGTIFLAVKATPAALRKIERRREECREKKLREPTRLDIIKLCWKDYVPSAITGTLSTACLLGANSVNGRRNAALATAYQLSETALSEYRGKVIEAVGERKEGSIRDEVAKDRITKNPPNANEIILTDKGDVLCLDSVSGRYFKTDIDLLKKAQNEINRRMISEMYISLNEFYDEIGLPPVSIGYDLGWNIEKDFLELRFSTQLAKDGTPCLVLEYAVAPEYNYH